MAVQYTEPSSAVNFCVPSERGELSRASSLKFNRSCIISPVASRSAWSYTSAAFFSRFCFRMINQEEEEEEEVMSTFVLKNNKSLYISNVRSNRYFCPRNAQATASSRSQRARHRICTLSCASHAQCTVLESVCCAPSHIVSAACSEHDRACVK